MHNLVIPLLVLSIGTDKPPARLLDELNWMELVHKDLYMGPDMATANPQPGAWSAKAAALIKDTQRKWQKAGFR